MPKPFRFGVMAEHVRTRADLLRTARAAEDTGYSTFLIRDHILEAPFGHQLGPLAALATVAAMTERLRIGTLVFANDYRPPALLAKEVATLDLLSEGRFEFGLGTGFLKAEYDHVGIPFAPPGVRVERFAASLRAYKALLSGQSATLPGVPDAPGPFANFPAPVQRPHPPLLVGAGGKRMLGIAAQEADIIGLLTVSTADGVMAEDPAGRLAANVAEKVGWIRDAAGGRWDALELSIFGTFVLTDDRRTAAASLIAARGWHDIAVEDVLAMPSILIGTVAEIAAQMHAQRKEYGFSYYIVSDSALEIVAPVVAEEAGR